MYNFNNRKAITKRKLSSHNLAINSAKCYNLEEDIKICKNCEKKGKENEIHMIFSCNEYDKIQRKSFSDINELDNIKLQLRNKVEKLKLFFAEGSLKALNILGEILMIALESM